MIVVSPDPFEPAEELVAFSRRAGDGAVLSFTGIVRGGEVTALELDHYPGFTEKRLGEIVEQVVARHGLTGAHVRHRVGPMAPGEPIMFAATSAPHRRAAFEGLDELMDRLKSEAPFWKKERRGERERWVEPTDDDRADLERWSRDAG